MNRSTAINAAEAISTYILAKDSNRPQLMKDAFAEDCELEMIVKPDAISFPGSAKGVGGNYQGFGHKLRRPV
jgi:hypothetical protein